MVAHILVVDDIEINRKLLTVLLEREGHKVSTVSSGSKAITAVNETSFDLVLMDLHMPDTNGIEATRIIRNAGFSSFQLPILAVTAGISEEDKVEAYAVNMNEYIEKPIASDEFMEIVKKWLS